MKSFAFFPLLLLLHFVVPAWANDAEVFSTPPDRKSQDGAIETVCDLVFAPSMRVLARALGPQRLEVSLRADRNTVRFEMRYECGGLPFDRLAEDAGFRRTESGWTVDDGQVSPVEVLQTSYWTGIARNKLIGTSVCRSVVGQTISWRQAFFVEFCVWEPEYRKYVETFDSVEKLIRVTPR